MINSIEPGEGRESLGALVSDQDTKFKYSASELPFRYPILMEPNYRQLQDSILP
jgi:hypothetical protein